MKGRILLQLLQSLQLSTYKQVLRLCEFEAFLDRKLLGAFHRASMIRRDGSARENKRTREQENKRDLTLSREESVRRIENVSGEYDRILDVLDGRDASDPPVMRPNHGIHLDLTNLIQKAPFSRIKRGIVFHDTHTFRSHNPQSRALSVSQSLRCVMMSLTRFGRVEGRTPGAQDLKRNATRPADCFWPSVSLR